MGKRLWRFIRRGSRPHPCWAVLGVDADHPQAAPSSRLKLSFDKESIPLSPSRKTSSRSTLLSTDSVSTLLFFPLISTYFYFLIFLLISTSRCMVLLISTYLHWKLLTCEFFSEHSPMACDSPGRCKASAVQGHFRSGGEARPRRW